MRGHEFLLNINSTKIKFGLKRTKLLLKACGSPQKKILSIQIAGTNGKGSTASLISNVLIENGYKVGLFTSPHLVVMNERIRINHQLISDYFINQFVLKHKKNIEKIGASYFEILSVMAMDYFFQNNIDIAILETGLGGKLDSITSMENSGLIFTTISYDHMQILGETIEEIAYEKSGAIKASNQFVISTQQVLKIRKILNKKAKQQKKAIHYVGLIKDNELKYLKGQYQDENATLASLALLQMEIFFQFKLNNMSQHIRNTFWPGRLQTIQKSPLIIFDVGHNAQGILANYDYFKYFIQKYNQKFLIIGFESTKKIIIELQKLVSLFDNIFITETGIKKSMDSNKLYKEINHPKMTVNLNLNQLLLQTVNQIERNDILLILGSHYFGGAINKIFKNCFDNDSNMY